ncbi:MAG: FxsA family protein [Oceanococcus sp.]
MPLILLIAWMVLESLLIAEVSNHIGGLPVFFLLLVIAALGVQLIQRQGFKVLAAVQASMQRQELPAATLLDSMIVFIAGTLLILPGFLSDGFALLMLFGGMRKRLANLAEQQLKKRHPEYRSPVTIDGEFHAVEEKIPLRDVRSDD